MRLDGSGKSTIQDGLQAGFNEILFLENINVSSDTTIQRGELLAQDSDTYRAATAADTDKKLVIAANDFTADSDNTVCQAYISGAFHSNKVKAAEGVVESLELELRRQSIILVKQHEV